MASVSVGATATLILAADNWRTSFMLVNNGSVIVYLGQTADITVTGDTTNDGIPLLPRGTVTESLLGGWRGNIWGITASGSADVRVWQRRA